MVLLALLLIDKEQLKKDKLTTILFISLLVVIFIAVMSTFVLPTILNTVAGNADFGGDTRGGETSVSLQLMSILKHPYTFAKLLIKNMFTLDTFGSIGYDTFLFPLLAFMYMGRYNLIADKYVILLIPCIIGLWLFGKEKNVKKHQTWCTILATLAVVALIWSALYLSFTPVGENYMIGVQARYYLPLMVPLMLVIPSPKITIQGKQIKEYTFAKTFWFFMLFLLWYGIYHNILIVSCI